jgi:integrase
MTNQKMNLYIKEVGEILVNNKLEDNSKKNSLGLSVVIDTDKYKRLGTHTARRSFATNLYLEGIPSQTIMKITTHTTEKNFLKYIRMTNNDAAETIGKHYKNKEAQKINSLTKVV